MHRVIGESAWAIIGVRLGAVVKEAQMTGVDVALESLEPVAVSNDGLDYALTVWQHIGLQVRQGRWLLSRTQVGPDNASALLRWIRDSFHFLLEVRFGGLVGHVDAVAVGVELPAVVDTPQAGLFVSPKEQ